MALSPWGIIGGATIGAVNKGVGGYFDRKNKLKLQQNDQAFQEMMASTNYQRKVKDMQKAGLNPALAAGGATSNAPVSSTTSGGNTNLAMVRELMNEYVHTGKMSKVSKVRPN